MFQEADAGRDLGVSKVEAEVELKFAFRRGRENPNLKEREGEAQWRMCVHLPKNARAAIVLEGPHTQQAAGRKHAAQVHLLGTLHPFYFMLPKSRNCNCPSWFDMAIHGVSIKADVGVRNKVAMETGNADLSNAST